MPDELRNAIQILPLNLDQYRQEEVYAGQDHILHPNTLPQDIDEAYYRTAAKSNCYYK